MHLALAVRDEDASRRFYEKYFGFEAARRAEDGTLMMRNPEGFSLALGRWEGDSTLPPFLHFGFRALSPDDVHDYSRRFRADGLEIVEEGRARLRERQSARSERLRRRGRMRLNALTDTTSFSP
jgi:catechol 2,3-dioxygenase-like lactoylglutathione lyase family enzyme